MIRNIKTRHMILGLLCAMYFIAYVDRVNIAVAAPFIAKEFNLSPTELGFIFSAFAYPYLVMQILGGWLADRFGPKKILLILSLIWGLATLLTGFIGGLITLVIMRVLLGVGEGGAFPTATRAMTSWMPKSSRGFAQGITHSFSRLGGAITPPIVLAIVYYAGWREAFIVLGVISLIWSLAYLLLFTDTPHQHKTITPAEIEEIGEPARKNKASGKTPWKDMISKMWLVTFVDFCYGWSLWVFLTWLPSYLKDDRGFDLKAMALFTTLPLLAGVIGDTLGGVISDKLYIRTKRLRFARVSVLSLGLFLAFLCIMPMIFIRDPLIAIVLISACFFFLELTNPVLWSLPMDIAGKYAGTAGGMMNSGFGLAGAISPVVFGFLIQTTGSYTLPFLISGGLLLVGAIAALMIDPNRAVREIVDKPADYQYKSRATPAFALGISSGHKR